MGRILSVPAPEARVWPLAALLALLALVAGGCDEGVDPTLGTAEAFTVWGQLDPTADQQALRVVPILDRLDAEVPDVLDATVTSTELGTGRTGLWRDSLVVFDDGSRGHVFVSDLVPTPGERVRIEVARSDGNTASVEVDVPPLVSPEVGFPAASGFSVTYPLRVRGAPRVNRGRLFYRVTGLPAAPSDTVEVEVPDVRQVDDLGGGVWGLDLDFLTVSRAFLSREYPGLNVRLVDVRFEAFVASGGWAFTPEEIANLSEPGTGSNVENGFGFVGAGYWTSVSWTPSATTQSRAGFFVDADPALAAFFNEASYEGWIELYNPATEPILLSAYRLREGAEGEGGAVFEIPLGTVVPPRGFVVLRPNFAIEPNLRIELINPRGDLVSGWATGLNVGTPGSLTSYGAYPDGFSQILPDRSDLFQRPLEPTPGEPNRPDTQPLVINEVYASGADGYVEVWRDPRRLNPAAVAVAVVEPDRPSLEWIPLSLSAEGYGVTPEGERFRLPLEGGRVLIRYRYPLDRWLVSDDRPYAAQTPEASAGYRPDGPDGTWTPGLVPTPAAPNGAGLP